MEKRIITFGKGCVNLAYASAKEAQEATGAERLSFMWTGFGAYSITLSEDGKTVIFKPHGRKPWEPRKRRKENA